VTAPPSLSVVVPVFNEPYWIGRMVESAVAAIGESSFADVEFVVVDDGSDAETRKALDSLDVPFPLRVIRQQNAGRFRARAQGIRAARNDLVLLLDSRVLLDRDACTFLAGHLNSDEARLVWNGHVEPAPDSNVFGRFWAALPAIFWGRYLRKPETTSYGLDEFDWFPKGTGCFVAPRALLLEALEEFSSLFDDSRHASDDTQLIRSIAARTRINISPGFSGVYVARSSPSAFFRHAYHRGIHFVDSYGRPGTRFFPTVVAFFPASVLGGLLLLARPRLGLLALAAPPIAGGLAVAARRPTRDAVAFGLLALPFTATYGAGIWRGGVLALTSRVRRRRDATPVR
jgi:glycosyltransferase involved in cell wall biosynthesis